MKKVVFSCNPVVNLLLHVICCFDSTFPRKPIYKKKALEWLSPDEIEFFENNFRMEQTGKVSSTANFAFLFQVPAYFASDTIGSLKKVFEAMKHKKLAILKSDFPQKGKLVDAYMPAKFQELFFDKALEKYKEAQILLHKYESILESVYDRFYKDYWKTLLADMERTAELLNGKYFERYDAIAMWEKKTRLGFPYQNFVVELADPISSLGTSLMAERDSFSHWIDLETIFTIISHEIGTHIIVQTETLDSTIFASIFQRDMEKTLRIEEALAYLTNLEIWKEQAIPLAYSRLRFEEAFREEIEALELHWGDYEAGKISYIDLIVEAFTTMSNV